MSLDRAIKHGKEHRKSYRGPKAISKQCRNHGSCNYCSLGRTYSSRKRTNKYTSDEINEIVYNYHKECS